MTTWHIDVTMVLKGRIMIPLDKVAYRRNHGIKGTYYDTTYKVTFQGNHGIKWAYYPTT